MEVRWMEVRWMEVRWMEVRWMEVKEEVRSKQQSEPLNTTYCFNIKWKRQLNGSKQEMYQKGSIVQNGIHYLILEFCHANKSEISLF